MAKKTKRQQRTTGAIIRIPLVDNFHSYGRILENDVAFYDIYTQDDLPKNEILKKPILFIVPVYDSVITKGYWQKISSAIPLESHLQKSELPPMYKKEIGHPEKVQLVYFDRFESATLEDCKDLEVWAVWTAEGIEKRLNQYFKKKRVSPL